MKLSFITGIRQRTIALRLGAAPLSPKPQTPAAGLKERPVIINGPAWGWYWLHLSLWGVDWTMATAVDSVATTTPPESPPAGGCASCNNTTALSPRAHKPLSFAKLCYYLVLPFCSVDLNLVRIRCLTLLEWGSISQFELFDFDEAAGLGYSCLMRMPCLFLSLLINTIIFKGADILGFTFFSI